jgi:hypothetical protein
MLVIMIVSFMHELCYAMAYGSARLALASLQLTIHSWSVSLVMYVCPFFLIYQWQLFLLSVPNQIRDTRQRGQALMYAWEEGEQKITRRR